MTARSVASTVDLVDPPGQALGYSWVLTSFCSAIGKTPWDSPSRSDCKEPLGSLPVECDQDLPSPRAGGREWALVLFHSTDPSQSAGSQSPAGMGAC